MAYGIDHKQLEIGQVDTEAEADQGGSEAGDPSRVSSQGRSPQQEDVADDPEDGDIDPEEVRIATGGNRLTTASPGKADRGTAAGLDDRDVSSPIRTLWPDQIANDFSDQAPD